MIAVSRATHHNEGDVRRKDVRVGDAVVVERAGRRIALAPLRCVARHPGPWLPTGL
jgi:hypothetical protein